MKNIYGPSLALVLAGCMAIVQVKAQSFVSTIAELADPYILYDNGNYYYTGTSGGDINLRVASTLEGLRTAKPNYIFGPAQGGPQFNYWAPELFKIDGKWYIYYTASNSLSHDFQRTYVIENASPDPLQGTWVNKGKIYDPFNDVWAIDGTVLALNGSNYFIWSGSDIADGTPSKPQNIYIAEMLNPWTLQGPRV